MQNYYQNLFSDLDLDFVKNPITKDVSIKRGELSISRSLRNLIQFNRFDKPFHPEIKSGIRELLFENNNPLIQISLEENIRNIINTYEPRVKIENISAQFNEDGNSVNISIDYKVVGYNREENVTLQLKRIR